MAEKLSGINNNHLDIKSEKLVPRPATARLADHTRLAMLSLSEGENN